MIPIHVTKNFPKNMAMVSYKVHNVCNFTCNYCEPNSNNGSERWNSNYKASLNFLNELRKRNEYLYLDIVGGEPTLWPELQPFINEASNENTLIEISTNGSRTLRYWEGFNPGNNVFTFSWHSKEVDTDHMANVINIMKDKCWVTVAVLLTPESWERGLNAIDTFKKLNVEVNIQMVRKTLGSADLYPYTPEQLNYIQNYCQEKSKINIPQWLKLRPTDVWFNGVKQNWTQIFSEGKITFTGWKCNAGIDRFTIIPDGSIFKCWPMVDGSIGNIYGEYQLPTEPTICTYKHPCHCKNDAQTEKWSPDFIAD